MCVCSTSADMKAMHVQIARVCGAMRDLQIETAGAQADELKALDGTSLEDPPILFCPSCHRHACRNRASPSQTQQQQRFDNVKNSVSRETRKAWDAAIKFFSIEHEFLKNWRNDIGGHFLDDAATYALDNIQASIVGSIPAYCEFRGRIQVGMRAKWVLSPLGFPITVSHGLFGRRLLPVSVCRWRLAVPRLGREVCPRLSRVHQ